MDESECENPLEVKAIIWEVKDGKPTKLKALNIIFVPEKGNVLTIKSQNQIFPDKRAEEKIPQITEPINEPTDKPEQELDVSSHIEVKDRGENISRVWNNNVFENVLYEIKEGISKDEDSEQLKSRITPYYPNSKLSSLGVYLHVHRKYLEEHPEAEDTKDGNDVKGTRIIGIMGVPIHANVLEKLKLYGDEQKMMEIVTSYYPNIKEKSVRKYLYAYVKYISGDISPKHYTDNVVKKSTKKIRKRRKPKGALGRDNTYNTWIMPDEHDSVKKAINKWGFTPTTESIADVTGLGMGRVRAIIHWMLKKHEIYMTRENLVPTYHNIATK